MRSAATGPIAIPAISPPVKLATRAPVPAAPVFDVEVEVVVDGRGFEVDVVRAKEA
jgi:hypothetical protein